MQRYEIIYAEESEIPLGEKDIMHECSDGDYVLYLDAAKEITQLRQHIAELEKENALLSADHLSESISGLGLGPVAEVEMVAFYPESDGLYRATVTSKSPFSPADKLYTSAPRIPEGWQLVPKEPTDEMIAAAAKLDWTNEDIHGNCINQWYVMLAAAPKPEDVK